MRRAFCGDDEPIRYSIRRQPHPRRSAVSYLRRAVRLVAELFLFWLPLGLFLVTFGISAWLGIIGTFGLMQAGHPFWSLGCFGYFVLLPFVICLGENSRTAGHRVYRFFDWIEFG